VAKDWLGRYRVKLRSGRKALAETPEVLARRVAQSGAGELLVYSIDRDGTWSGYELELLARIAETTDIPVVACGGASGPADFARAVTEAGCAAVAAGSLFVYQSRGKGVLINYPEPDRLMSHFS
jgi:cyclase